VVAAAIGYVVNLAVASPIPTGAAMRAEIVRAFDALGRASTSTASLRPYVQGADRSLVSAITRSTPTPESTTPMLLPDALSVSSIRQTGSVATVAFSAANAWGPSRFSGTAIYDGGRWKVSYVTVCMLIEQEGDLCPRPPAGVRATVPLPYSVTDAAHIAGQTSDLLDPETLAMTTDGSVLIVDPSRDEVLRWRTDGALSVYAGNGRVGSSGDGGPAVNAELDLKHGAGITVAPNGTVYIADAGNCRLQAVNPAGTIRTASDADVLCSLGAIAVSPAGVAYVTTQSEVDDVAPDGEVTRVAGGGQETIASEGPYYTPQTIDFSPYSLAFDGAGNLDIWSFEPRAIFRLTPTRTIAQIGGYEYATVIAPSPTGSVLIADYHGGIDRVTAMGIVSDEPTSPKDIAGLPWRATSAGFQVDGIAVARSGAIYVDNDAGNGFGDGTVLVELAPGGRGHVVAVRTPLIETLPPVGAAAFPSSIYPAPAPARGGDLLACPNSAGLEPFDASARGEASSIAAEFNSGTLSNDLENADRSWWQGDFAALQGGDVGGEHMVLASGAASDDVFSAAVASACGAMLVRDSLVVDIGQSSYSGEVSHLYFIDRRGHPLVYFQAS
jgi:hypothetical protein